MNLSYSALELLHTCPRKFELSKLAAPEGEEGESLDLLAGSALHAGIQAAFQNLPLSTCIWEAYKVWVVERGVDYYEASTKKSLLKVCMHIQKFHAVRDEVFADWDLAEMNGRPAVEIGFRVALPRGDFYRGWIDLVLKHRHSEEYAALELKTTGLKDVNPAVYENSFQGMSYACIVDKITGLRNPRQIFYVFEFDKANTLEQRLFEFWRSPTDKQSWLPSLALDSLMLRTYNKAGHFPMRGSSCFQYFRPCYFMRICNLPRQGEYDLQSKEEKAGTYDYEFTLEDLQNEPGKN